MSDYGKDIYTCSAAEETWKAFDSFHFVYWTPTSGSDTC